jgi:hypothetical protein
MLRDQGVRISFSNPGEPIPSLANPNVLLSFENSLSVGVHPEDQAIYLEVMRDYNRFGFLRFVTDSFFSKSPIEGNYATGARMAADAFSDLGAEQRDTLLKRGFMTSHLLVHLKPSRPLGNLGYGDTVSEYELLNRQGFTPFGSEELYGMANRLIQDSIEQRPEIADELRKRRENKNSR